MLRYTIRNKKGRTGGQVRAETSTCMSRARLGGDKRADTKKAGKLRMKGRKTEIHVGSSIPSPVTEKEKGREPVPGLCPGGGHAHDRDIRTQM